MTAPSAAPELFGQAWFADPYPIYRRLRETEPVHRLNGAWLVSRYDDVTTLLKDERCSSQRAPALVGRLPADTRPRFEELARSLSLWMLLLDPPDHTRIRGLVGKAFTPSVVERLRERVQGLVRELLEAPVSRGALDVIADLAYPLPVIVISELLGVPVADRDLMKRWSDDIAGFFANVAPSLDQAERAQNAVREMTAYFRSLIAARRKAPKEDLLSRLVSVEERGDVLSQDELLALCSVLLFGGHETTTNLIGNGVLTLLRHPEALAALRAEPSLLDSAVEELLRFESPVQYVSRVALAAIELRGRVIEAGQPLLLLIGSANRDPGQFREPDRLDLARKDNRHLSFGHGIHFCIGAALSRLEGRVALKTVLERFPNLRLASDDVRWQATIGFRALSRLDVAF